MSGTPGTPNRALALSSSRTPHQQRMMSGTQGRNKLDAEAIIANGIHSGRRVITPGSANRDTQLIMSPSPSAGCLSPSASRFSIRSDMSDAAGMSSARRTPVDPKGAGGLARGVKKVDSTGNRAALAHNGSGALEPRKELRMLKKLNGREGSIEKDLGNVKDQVVYNKGKRCDREVLPKSPNIDGKDNVFIAKEASVGRRSEELAAQKDEFKKQISPKNRNFTFQPVERVDKRNPEDRLMDNGSVPRKTKKTNFVNSMRPTSAKQAATPPWVHTE